MNNGYFGLNGLLGFFISIVILLSIVAVLGSMAISIQKKEATNYYSIDEANVKMIDVSNKNNYKLNGVN